MLGFSRSTILLPFGAIIERLLGSVNKRRAGLPTFSILKSLGYYPHHDRVPVAQGHSTPITLVCKEPGLQRTSGSRIGAIRSPPKDTGKGGEISLSHFTWRFTDGYRWQDGPNSDALCLIWWGRLLIVREQGLDRGRGIGFS